MEILGIDIGGSGIKGAIVNTETGELVTPRYRLPTPESALPDDVADTLRQVVEHFNWMGPVGCGFPTVVLNGVVKTAANIDESWIETDAEKLFSKFVANPTYVVNDADAAGIAEMAFGVGKDSHHGVVIMITLGTGIGSAIFTQGVLVPNTEFGHILIRGKDAERRASDAARKRKDLSWQEWSERLQEYFSTLEGLFWPDLFIIGGGVCKEADNFFPYLNLRTKIVQAQMQNQAGIIGAALYASKYHS